MKNLNANELQIVAGGSDDLSTIVQGPIGGLPKFLKDAVSYDPSSHPDPADQDTIF